MGAAEYNGTSCSLFFMRPGNRLRELRKAAKLTQVGLAERTGVAQPTISQIESGSRSMDLAWMRTFARALGCAPADLLERDDNPDVLDEHERHLIKRYRLADRNQRGTLERVAAAIIPLPDDTARKEDAA
jgi:transcriptional regulator with XRE-family HTH domain